MGMTFHESKWENKYLPLNMTKQILFCSIDDHSSVKGQINQMNLTLPVPPVEVDYSGTNVDASAKIGSRVDLLPRI